MSEKYKLTDEEKRLVEESKKRNKEHEEKSRLFWKNEYPNYSRDKKVKYWLRRVYGSMRIQGEATADQYSAFSLDWHDAVKSIEPDFDAIFKSVVPLLGFDFDWDEYRKRISS